MTSTRIEVTRSGGFAGIPLHASVDTGTLPPDEAHEIAALVDRVDFAGLTHRPAPPAQGPDRFHYDIAVEHGSTRHEVSLPETAVPADLKALLDRVVARAKGG